MRVLPQCLTRVDEGAATVPVLPNVSVHPPSLVAEAASCAVCLRAVSAEVKGVVEGSVKGLGIGSGTRVCVCPGVQGVLLSWCHRRDLCVKQGGKERGGGHIW